MRRKILALLLTASLIFSMAGNALAASFSDTSGHWGEEAIDYWSDEGIVGGVGGTKFDPDGLVTRAQAAAILARLLKLTEMADLSKYTDCEKGEWYYDSIAKCVAAGIMNGTSETTMEPHTYLTRAQMFTMFCRATGIAGQDSINKYYIDYNKTPDFAKVYLNALVNLGYVGGTSLVTMEPNTDMSRASLVVMLRKAIAAYVTEGGTVEVSGNGIVLVVTNATTQITGNFTGTIVTTQPDTVISLSGLNGKVEVIANANNIKVVNAPNGTTVTSSNGAENVTVNNIKVDVNDSETVVTPSAPVAPSVPSGGTTHTHYYVSTVTTPATCEQDGVMTYYCSGCGSAYTAPIAAIGHTWNEGVVTTPATCTVNGVKTFTCINDGTHTRTEAITAPGHKDEDQNFVCDVCEEDLCTEHTEATREENRVEATCGTDGSYVLVTYCSKCEVVIKEETKTIPATGEHTYGDWQKDETGHWKVCTADECGAETAKESHVFTTILEPTCNTPGSKKCDVCERDAEIPVQHTDDNGDGICDICVKFYLSITAAETADITVYDDYSAEIVLPAGDLDPSSVTLKAIMQNVASLGAAGQTKSEEFTLSDTGLTGSPSLYDWLIEAWEFNSGKIVATIDSKEVTYTLSGNGDPTAKEDVTITATAETEAARAAWQALTANITTSNQTPANSYVLLKNGSYVQIGGDKLVVGDVSSDLELNNLNDMESLKQTIKNGVKVIEDVGSDEIEIVLTKGTALAVGQSIATLDKDATIAIGGVDVTSLENVLVNMRTLGNQDDYMGAAKILIGILGDVIAAADNSTITVDITFSEPAVPGPVVPAVTEKFYLGVSAGATASMTVMSDYSATIVLPAADLNPSSVTLTARMTDVASLGAAGQTKSETFTLSDTGLTGSPSLYDWLIEAWEFNSGKIVATIDSKEVTYTLSGNGDPTAKEDVTITATAETEAARAAWQALTANITTSNQTPANSYVLLKNGSYVQIGGDKLVVGDVSSDLELNNLNDMESLKQTIKNGVKVIEDVGSNEIVIVLTKGTALAVGQSIATLDKDATIVIGGVDVTSLENVLVNMRTLGNQDDYMGAAKILIGILGDVIAAADNNTITVNITFA